MDCYELPYPPSVNSYWRYVRNRAYLSRKAREYRKLVAVALREQLFTPLGGEIELAVTIFPPDRRRRDIDNVLKALLDSLQYAGLYDDDYQISRLVVEREKKVHGGMVLIMPKER